MAPRPSKPGAGSGEATGDFLGVPDGYTAAPSPGDWFTPGRQITGDIANPPNTAGAGRMILGANGPEPKYETGVEAGLLDFTTEEVARLQIRMAKAGLIGPETKFRLGQVLGTSDPTYTAFKKLLGAANRYGVSYSEMLKTLERTPLVTAGKDGVNGTGSGPSRHTTVTEPVFTDKTTARATIRAEFEAELGRAPTAEDYENYLARLRSAESGADVTTQVTKGGKTTITRSDDTTDPSAAVVADDMIRRGKLGKERNTRMVATDYMEMAMGALGPGGGLL